MRHALTLHPESHCEAVRRIEVEATRQGSRYLLLRYFVFGNMDALAFPPPGKTKRGDSLWKHSCFEAFVRAAPGEAYCELNFAPSYDWAAYEFDGYRNGMRDCTDIAIQYLVTTSNAHDYELRVSLDLEDLPRAGAALHLGLSAVIEEVTGNKSYWALAHPAGAPDFHHSDCFALQLPPQEEI